MSVSLEAKIPPQAPTATVDSARTEFVTRHGLEIMSEPFALTPDQERAVLEDFGRNPVEVATRAVESIDAQGVNRIAVWDQISRGGVFPIHDFREASPGDVVPVMPVESDFALESRLRSTVSGEAAVAARAYAMQSALRMLGVDERDIPAQLDQAHAVVYNSPENGAPIVTERVIEAPQGTVYEMNLHGAGSPRTVDTNVVVVKK